MFCMLVYLRAVCFSLSSIVKHFEFLKVLCKFPIIIIIIIIIVEVKTFFVREIQR